MKKIQTLERVWTETQRTTYVVPQKKPIFVLQKSVQKRQIVIDGPMGRG